MPRLLLLFAFALAPSIAAGQAVVNLGPGQTSPGNFASGTIVNVNGGVITTSGGFMGGGSLSNGVLNINAGSVGSGFTNSGNEVSLSGGTVGEFFANFSNTELSISGGTIGSFGLFSGSSATITGGQVLRFPDVFSSGTINIFGGDLFSLRLVDSGARANFFGSAFALDGVPLDLELGESVFVTPATGQNFSATLADGSPFEFDLNPIGPFSGANPDEAAPGSIIQVTLTPILGDANADGGVSAADFVLARDTLGGTVAAPFAAADGDGDEFITPADIAAINERFGTSGGPTLSDSTLGDSTLASTAASAALAIPEPSAAVLVVLALSTLGGRRRRG